jgi:hypothetical protein
MDQRYPHIPLDLPQRRTNNRGRLRRWLRYALAAIAALSWSSLMILIGMLVEQFRPFPFPLP